MHAPDLLGWVNCADKFILVELCELIVLGYDLSDTQEELRCWRNGIYILWLTSLSDLGPVGPLVLHNA